MRDATSWRWTALVVVAYAVAMAYVESAVVVYLERALGADVGAVFPIRPIADAGDLAAIEIGREAATIVMIASVGVLAGRSRLERLAWVAVTFGAWDIGYYAWLYVFAGWPPSPATTDLLFLIPVPWAGPVLSPVLVSVVLVAVGLVASREVRRGRTLHVGRRQWAAAIVGGFLIIVSYTLDAPALLAGGLPGPYPWPVFAVGMLLAVAAAVDVLRPDRAHRGAPDAHAG